MNITCNSGLGDNVLDMCHNMGLKIGYVVYDMLFGDCGGGVVER